MLRPRASVSAAQVPRRALVEALEFESLKETCWSKLSLRGRRRFSLSCVLNPLSQECRVGPAEQFGALAVRSFLLRLAETHSVHATAASADLRRGPAAPSPRAPAVASCATGRRAALGSSGRKQVDSEERRTRAHSSLFLQVRTQQTDAFLSASSLFPSSGIAAANFPSLNFSAPFSLQRQRPPPHRRLLPAAFQLASSVAELRVFG